ncbi:hypothetical protein INT47_010838 [Mucor saturninus]|uniref:Uncharacterized protein n=1 Tax=Mucor saturninus TaxID=64648 RepID=A0A8H7QYJ0_9FUNG|nr:hypothetical protein INT47_010838 [Mucor saturninus]
MEKLFQTADTASDKENTMMVTKLSSVDADMSFFEDEDECEDEADLLVESNSDLNDDKSITLDNTQKDLTAKEVRALSTVCIMLIQSSTIGNEVDAKNIFEKLYLDTQESIPRAALDFCAKLVNGLRKIRCKKEEECLGSFFGMRKLRNLIVGYAKEHYKRNRMGVCSLYPISDKKISIRVDRVKSTLKNYSKLDIKARAELEEAPKNNDGLNDIVNVKEAVRNLNVGIKESKAKQARLSRLLLPLEKLRMDQARNFRIEERGKDKWDEKKYNDLKEARANCDKIYSELKSVRATISNNQTEMYRLNKILHKQPLPADNINKEVISDKDITSLAKGDIVVQGIDPGVVTTASFKGVSGSLLFESINRYTALKNLDPVESATNEKQVSLEFTAKMVNNATFSTKHRQERHRRENQKIQTDVSYLEKKRLTRKIRTKKFYQVFFSRHRKRLVTSEGKGNNNAVWSFLGNWSGITTFMKGHTRRSLKPVITELQKTEKDTFMVVDEYKSTVTCTSCFETTTKQVVRRGDTIKRIKGAVVCVNKDCPRRMHNKSTTSNRDQNGALNIALIGFSALVSEDGLTLPPFRRGVNNPNKFNLSNNLMQARLAMQGSPGEPVTNFSL